MKYFIAALALIVLLGCSERESYYIEITDGEADIVHVNRMDRFDTREECQSRVVWIIANHPDTDSTITYRCIEGDQALDIPQI